MHHFPESFARYWTAFVLCLIGLMQLLWPRFFDETCLFARRVRSMPPDDRQRLEHIIDARAEAEGRTQSSLRWLGFFGIAMAALELIPEMQFAIPYALYCLVSAAAAYVRYTRIRRASERRAAPLVSRKPTDALSVGAMIAMVGGFIAVVLFGFDPHFRIGAIAVGISMLLLAFVAWQIACGRALMFGDDPQMEYVVDQRVRALRVNSTVALACAPAVVLIGMSNPWMTTGYEAYGNAAFILSYGAFFFAMAWIFIAERRSGRQMLHHA